VRLITSGSVTAPKRVTNAQSSWRFARYCVSSWIYVKLPLPRKLKTQNVVVDETPHRYVSFNRGILIGSCPTNEPRKTSSAFHGRLYFPSPHTMQVDRFQTISPCKLRRVLRRDVSFIRSGLSDALFLLLYRVYVLYVLFERDGEIVFGLFGGFSVFVYICTYVPPTRRFSERSQVTVFTVVVVLFYPLFRRRCSDVYACTWHSRNSNNTRYHSVVVKKNTYIRAV